MIEILTTPLFVVFTALLPVFAVMVCPAKHLPNCRRGGWGKHAK